MKTLLILVDGMCPDALSDLPLVQKYISRGASTMQAKTVMPSVTLPCHISLFHSVDPSRHGTTTNDYAPQVRPVKGLCEVLAAAKKALCLFLRLGGNLPAMTNPAKIVNTRKIALLFTITYMVSYLTRINFGAIVSEMERATGISKQLLSMSLTGLFITYGVGQIVSGKCGDLFSPKKLVTLGLLVSSVVNLIIPLCGNPWQMLIVWCINGFAQAFMWPPMVRLMVAHLSQEDYNRTVVKVSWGSSIGTIIMYLFAPVLISLFNWKSVFFFSAACGLLGFFLWNALCIDTDVIPVAKDKQQTSNLGYLFAPVMLGVMLAIILQGMLRDGVTTWMPSLISETYHLGSAISILTGVALPLFSILSFQVASSLYRKYLRNPLLCAGAIFGIGMVSALVLYLSIGQSAILSVLFSALLTGCMHGVNLILICMIPPFFQKYGITSTASGVLNSCTYIGSAISTYGIAYLSKNIGWQDTVLLWVLIALAGTVICLLCTKPWAKAHP